MYLSTMNSNVSATKASSMFVSSPTAKHTIDSMVEPGEDDVTNCHKKRKDARLELVADHNPLFCQTVDTTELLTATKASSILVSSPTAKHTFDSPVDAGEDDATTNCHEKRKDARLEPVVDRDPLFCQTVDTTEVLSLDRHPM